jgi:hypothetical protein
MCSGGSLIESQEPCLEFLYFQAPFRITLDRNRQDMPRMKINSMNLGFLLRENLRHPYLRDRVLFPQCIHNEIPH